MKGKWWFRIGSRTVKYYWAYSKLEDVDIFIDCICTNSPNSSTNSIKLVLLFKNKK